MQPLSGLQGKCSMVYHGVVPLWAMCTRSIYNIMLIFSTYGIHNIRMQCIYNVHFTLYTYHIFSLHITFTEVASCPQTVLPQTTRHSSSWPAPWRVDTSTTSAQESVLWHHGSPDRWRSGAEAHGHWMPGPVLQCFTFRDGHGTVFIVL